jgi:DNA polymerase-3 subunit epsilon
MSTTIYSREREDSKSVAQKVIQSRPVFLDTETTGLDKTDEIVEISIIEFDGSILLQSLVKPTSTIPAKATRIHGISNSDVQKAPPWPFLWPKIRSLLYGRMIAAYNAPFDLRMMQQTHNRYRMPWRETFNWFDAVSYTHLTLPTN